MRALARAVLFALMLMLVAACSTADDSARVKPMGGGRVGFEPVSRVLEARCGMLDCHGSMFRNFRLYGEGGLRLREGADTDGGIAPDQGPTRPREIDANHEAVISIEPEVMRAVVEERGASPERLTLIRKARNAEVHKGSDPIHPGDSADRCILSWLSSNVDKTACTAAAPPSP